MIKGILCILLLSLALPVLADSPAPFVRLVDSLVARLPNRDEPIKLFVGKFDGDDASKNPPLSTIIKFLYVFTWE